MLGAVALFGLVTPPAPADQPVDTLPARQAPPISTDRPGNGNAATTVPRLRLQIETSINYLTDTEPAGDSQQLFAPTGVRFGMLPWLELRLLSGILGVDLESSPATAYVTDTAFGLKGQLLQAGFDLATGIDVFFPTGAGPFDGGAIVPEWRLLAAVPLPSGLGLLLNAGVDLPEVDGDRRVRPLHVVNVGYSPPILDGRLGVFVESFARHPTDGSEQPWQFDAGATYLLNDDLQLDAFTQHGLTSAAPDLQIAGGVSGRF